jgi:hypothetical protein
MLPLAAQLRRRSARQLVSDKPAGFFQQKSRAAARLI